MVAPLAEDPGVAREQMRLALFKAYDYGKGDMVDAVFKAIDKAVEAAEKQNDELRKHLAWMAQTMHQAYHQDVPTTWKECRRDVCASTRHILERAGQTAVLRPSDDGTDSGSGDLSGT